MIKKTCANCEHWNRLDYIDVQHSAACYGMSKDNSGMDLESHDGYNGADLVTLSTHYCSDHDMKKEVDK